MSTRAGKRAAGPRAGQAAGPGGKPVKNENAFFDAMAATIVFGLLAATLLTLIVIPVGYALAFGVREPCKGS